MRAHVRFGLSRACNQVVALGMLVATSFASTARADDPSFTFAKKEDIKTVVWKASISAGLVLTSGNSSTVTASGALSISRNDGWNKVSLDANGAYAQSQVLTPTDLNGDTLIDANEAKTRVSTLTAATWFAKLRYDRFFTERNSGYVDGFVGQDLVAGISLLGGGQIGYSRLLFKTTMNELALEAGYDFSYKQFTAVMTPSVDIHSVRLFAGYVLTLTATTALNASVEALLNVNDVDIGPAGDPATHHGPVDAYRMKAKVGITTQLYKNISIKFGFALKYDNAPAPLTLTLPMGTMLAAGVVPRAEKLDTITEAALVVTFL